MRMTKELTYRLKALGQCPAGFRILKTEGEIERETTTNRASSKFLLEGFTKTRVLFEAGKKEENNELFCNQTRAR